MDFLGSVREMITEVLAGVSPDARLTELADSPDGQWYTIRVHVPGTISKPLVVPKGLVLSARSHAASLRTLRNVLRLEVRMQRSRIAIDTSRETLAGLPPERAAICSRCLASIAPQESVRYEHCEVFHLKCGKGA